MPSNSTPEIAIIGAGMSGLCMAIALERAGIHSWTIYEKAQRVGGTWRDNSYPGSGCDVPSHLYSYSFERRADWTRAFARQPEILSYFEQCAAKYRLHRRIRSGVEIASARFESGRWALDTTAGERIEANIVIPAVGQLNRPRVPDLDGLATFAGTRFHSARWNHEHALPGRRVAMVGNAASAVQIVPRIAPVVRHLSIFQRSANWIIPKPDREYSRVEKALFRLPGVERAYRDSIYWRLEARFPVLVRPGALAKLVERTARRHLEAQVSDPALRAALVPDYPVGCKRVLISDDYYPALMRGNVSLVQSPIERVVPDGIVTRDGRTHEIDTLVFATGFETTEFLAPMDVRGVDGGSLRERWRDGAEAYLGMCVAGFPNLFVLYGPNTNLGHNSIIFMVECQVGYVVQCIEALAKRGASSMDVRDDVMRAYSREIESRMQDTVWAADCGSWYKTASGRVVNNWPDFTYRYRRRLRRAILADFHLRA